MPRRCAMPRLPFTSETRSSSTSSEPNLLMSSAAVFGPMPSTPGTLSMLSPISASTSPTCSGPTPNFSRTSSAPKRRLRMVSRTNTSPQQSCMRSLSDEQITTSMPGAGRDLGQAGDDVVGLEPRHLELGQAERVDDPADQPQLGRQLGRHRGAVGLVLGIDLVAEIVARRVVHHAQVGRPLLPLDAQDHLAQAVDGAGLQPLGRRQRRQGVERPEQKIVGVDDVEARLALR